MGNSSSFMEKIYIYLPVVMFHSRMDYSDMATVRNIRTAYFAEQAVLFLFMVYFVMVIRLKNDKREILVPDISTAQLMMNTVPKTGELKFRRTTYLQHEMTQVLQDLQQSFLAFLLTILVHFTLDIRPIILLQVFAAPYNFIENRLLRKYVLGLKRNYRVWGERFDGEINDEHIVEGSETPGTAVATLSGTAEAVTEDAVPSAGGSMPVVTARVSQGDSNESVAQAEALAPMPKALEDALIDAWDAGDNADWSAVVAQLGPFSVNCQTPRDMWSPLMVACGLPKVGDDDVKNLLWDLEACVDLQDNDGWTCAHWAAKHGRPGALRVVIDGIVELASEPEAGARTAAEFLSVRDKDGKTAAEIARSAGRTEAVLEEFLDILAVGGEREAVHPAVASSD